MYERSAIVLEKYFENFFGFSNKQNLLNIRKLYERLIEEIERCQNAVRKEENTIAIFDDAAEKIQKIQKTQTQIYNRNLKLEEIRNQIFCEIGENKEKTLEKLDKLEKELFDNEDKIRNLKVDYIENLGIFLESQAQRMLETKERRLIENSQLELVGQSEEEIKGIDLNEIKKLKEFAANRFEEMAKEIEKIMFENGKNEPIGFNKKVIKNAVAQRIEIAKEEAKCYVLILERLKRVIIEQNNNQVQLIKYKKIEKDVSAKLSMMEAKKAYIVGYLDNERVTVISGKEIHNELMDDVTKDFLLDMQQIDNLYELVLREIASKSTKKAYDELYNKTYLKDIESNDQTLKQEINNMNIHTATVISANYWRTYGIKNIFAIFKEIVVGKYDKDLSEYEEKVVEEDVLGFESDIFDEFEKSRITDVEDDMGAIEYDYEFEKDEYDEDVNSDEKVIQNEDDDEEEDYEDADLEEVDDYEDADLGENLECEEDEDELEENEMEDDDFSDLVELSDLESEEDEEENVEVEFSDEEEEDDDYYNVYDDDDDDDDDDSEEDEEDEGNIVEEKKNIFNKMFGEGKKSKRK